MRETTYSFAKNILSNKTIIELNKIISENLISIRKDSEASGIIWMTGPKFR